MALINLAGRSSCRRILRIVFGLAKLDAAPPCHLTNIDLPSYPTTKPWSQQQYASMKMRSIKPTAI